MKLQTIEELNRLAEQKKEEEIANGFYDEVEIALIPVVIGRRNGKVDMITDGNIDRIFKMENIK